VRLAATWLLTASSALLALALLVQAFTAGMAAMADPDWWQIHVAWVHVFQWLVLIVLIGSAAASTPRRVKWAGLVPTLLVGLQYVLAHRGKDGSFPVGLGLHAANAFVLFGVSLYLFSAAWNATRCRY
jgi:hypothetical protein